MAQRGDAAAGAVAVQAAAEVVAGEGPVEVGTGVLAAARAGARIVARRGWQLAEQQAEEDQRPRCRRRGVTGALSPDARKRGVGGSLWRGGKCECHGQWPLRPEPVLRPIGGQRLHRRGRGPSLLDCPRAAIELLLDAAALSSRACLCLLDVLVSCDHCVRLRPDAGQCFRGVVAPLSAAFEPERAAPSHRDVWRGRAHRERGGRRLGGAARRRRVSHSRSRQTPAQSLRPNYSPI